MCAGNAAAAVRRGANLKDKQAGYYSVRQEQFLTDKERGPDGEFGPEWGEVEFREEENYYFKLSAAQRVAASVISRSHPDCVSPISARQSSSTPSKNSAATSASRARNRGLRWGIELPFDPEYVNYVWFDALTNYVSFIGYDPAQSNFNAQAVNFPREVAGAANHRQRHSRPGPWHLLADHAASARIPRRRCHAGARLVELAGTKMSKSAGNVVDPKVLVDKYGTEALRYYLMRKSLPAKTQILGGGFLVSEFNLDLANTLGNLVNRTLNMIHRFRNGKIKVNRSLPLLAQSEVQSHLQTLSDGLLEDGRTFYTDKFAQFRPSNALSAPLNRALACNELVEISAPWNLAKNKEQEELLEAVLYHLAESLRVIAILHFTSVAPCSAWNF